MKSALLLGIALAGLLPAETLQQGERDRAMSHLHVTRKMFLDSLEGVSAAQWAWKPSPEVWSVAEVAEHIALSEDMLMGLVKKVVAGPAATAEQKAEAKGKDEFVLKALVDRSKKAQAPEPLKPTNKWKTKEELIAAFKKSRDNTISYVQTTADDLRGHATPHPVFKQLDGYQWVLLISGHAERHILQLQEVKAMSGFPK
ncbi:MAG: DinB family protein [Bryobacterales bacterium]|nr:DinB family protein [Bryobacterales bacterium]